MDILYIVGKNKSKCNDEELKFSLRSIEKYGHNVSRVFVAGYCPEWLSSNVIKVPFDDPYPYDNNISESLYSISRKHANIIATLLHVIDITDIGDEFLVSMDDHFYIRDVDFNNYPFYCKKYNNGFYPFADDMSSDYRRFLAKTREYCEKQHLYTFYLTIHRNMHCSRTIVNECRKFLDEVVKNMLPIEPWSYLLNYRLTKYNDFFPTLSGDVKLSKAGPKDIDRINSKYTEVFSSVDFNRNSIILDVLHTLFPEPSKYEIDGQTSHPLSYGAPKITVVVPVYNTEKYLRTCLDSIVNQTFMDIEIILINDGSTDGSLKILNEYAEKDKRIRVVTTENRGCALTRNLGTNLSNCDYICFIDSDDYIDSKFLEELYSYAWKKYDLIRGIRIFGSSKHGRNPYGGAIHNILFKKSFLIKNGITFKNIPHEDVPFKKECYEKTKRIFDCPDKGIYYHYIIREGSLCNYSQEQIKESN